MLLEMQGPVLALAGLLFSALQPSMPSGSMPHHEARKTTPSGLLPASERLPMTLPSRSLGSGPFAITPIGATPHLEAGSLRFHGASSLLWAAPIPRRDITVACSRFRFGFPTVTSTVGARRGLPRSRIDPFRSCRRQLPVQDLVSGFRIRQHRRPPARPSPVRLRSSLTSALGPSPSASRPAAALSYRGTNPFTRVPPRRTSTSWIETLQGALPAGRATRRHGWQRQTSRLTQH